MVTLTHCESPVMKRVGELSWRKWKRKGNHKIRSFLHILPFREFFKKKERDIFYCVNFNFANSLLIYLWLPCNSTLRYYNLLTNRRSSALCRNRKGNEITLLVYNDSSHNVRTSWYHSSRLIKSSLYLHFTWEKC